MLNKRIVGTAFLVATGVQSSDVLAAVHGNTMSSGYVSPSPIAPSFGPAAPTARSGPPKGWTFASNAEPRYKTWTDIAQGLAVGARYSGIFRAGRGTTQNTTGTHLQVQPVTVSGAEFGTVMQGISAEKYRGKRICLSAQLSTQEVVGQAALWMRVDGQNGKVLGIDNMATRPVTGTTTWSRHEIVLDVPPESATIEVGFLLAGSGEVRAAQFNLDVVDSSTPVTASNVPVASDALPKAPVNLELHM